MGIPALSSGEQTASAAIFASPARLCGVFIVHDGSANALTLEIWDSPDSTLTGDIQLTPDISIGASPAAGALSQLFWFDDEGIKAYKGIYAKLTFAGSAKYVVYYK